MSLKSVLIPDEAEDKSRYCSLKILLPSSAVGYIMGKNGDSVYSLEVSTGTKITMSGVNEYYPGTKDRVCLISGNIDSVSRANRVITEKMFSNPVARGMMNYNTQMDSSSRRKQVKLIIPQCVASKVIGKCGSMVEKIKEQSGSFIRLSRKAFPLKLRERFVTVSGELRNIDIACRMILELVAHETNADYYKNVVYSGANLLLPNAFMSGPPLARACYNFTTETLPESFISPSDLMLFLEQMKSALLGMGFPEESVNFAAESIHFMSKRRALDTFLSLMINYFNPRIFSVSKGNKGIAGLRKAPSASQELVNPSLNLPPSNFEPLDPALKYFFGPISAPTSRMHGQRFTPADSNSSAVSDLCAIESD